MNAAVVTLSIELVILSFLMFRPFVTMMIRPFVTVVIRSFYGHSIVCNRDYPTFCYYGDSTVCDCGNLIIF